MVLMKIAHIVSRHFLSPDEGGKLKTASLASALSKVGDLHVLCFDNERRHASGENRTAVIALPFGGTATFHEFLGVSAKKRFSISLMAFLEARKQAELPVQWAPETARHGAIWSRLGGLKPDVVVADDTALAPFAAFWPSGLRIIHAHNVESSLHRELGRMPGMNRRRMLRRSRLFQRIERDLFPRVDQVWCVKPEDAEQHQALGVPGARLLVMPNVVPERAFRKLLPLPDVPTGIFFGPAAFAPNLEAARLLLKAGEELSPAGLCFKLLLVGKGMREAFQAQDEARPWLEVRDFVPDLGELLEQVSCVIIPLVHGGGTKLKTLEALASGRTVLTTPIGAEGLDLVDGEHAIIREWGQKFITAARDLLSHPDAHCEIGRRGQGLVVTRFSQAALEARVSAALQPRD